MTEWTAFRFGFPYARPAEGFKHAVVILSPSENHGFREVSWGARSFRLPASDPGPAILGGLGSEGCSGRLEQYGEGRDLPDLRSGELAGLGSSMQLALALAAFARYRSREEESKRPLMLLSAALSYPRGAPPFLGAAIENYCTEEEVSFSLLDKYEAAILAEAAFLVLPERDAEILCRELTKAGRIPVRAKIGELRGGAKASSPIIVPAEPHSLPILAEAVGISRFHFSEPRKRATSRLLYVAGLALALGLGIAVGMLILWKSEGSRQNERRFDLMRIVFDPANQGRRNRLRDEALREFLGLERRSGKADPAASGAAGLEENLIDLKEADLRHADLSRTDLSKVNLLNALFQNANLNEASLRASFCKGASFAGAHLFRADLSRSVLSQADLSGANLRKAVLSGCAGLGSAKLFGALFDQNTVWPDDFSAELAARAGAVFSPGSDQPVFVTPSEPEQKKSGIR